MIKISMMSYTMSRQKESFDLREMLKLTAELNLDGIDFVRLHDTPARELRKMTDDLGIPVVCHTFFASLNHATSAERQPALDAVKEGVEAAVELGAPTVMIPTPNKGDTFTRDQARSNWIEGLKEAKPIADEAGVTLTVENFPGANSPFVLADDVLHAVNEVPGLKLTFDSGNAGSGEDPATSFQECSDYVVHAHFKDWYRSDSPDEGYRQMLDGRYYKSALIGEGVIDHKSVMRAMKAAGYNGCVNIEYEGNEYAADDAVRRATDYLRRLDAEITASA